MESNTAGQEEYALSLETLWLMVLMSVKYKAIVWLKQVHSQVRQALTCITTWYLFLKENPTMWYCMVEQMLLPVMKERVEISTPTVGVEIIYCRTVINNTYSYISSNHENWFKALCNENRRYSITSFVNYKSAWLKMETQAVIILTVEDCIWTVKVFCNLLKIWLGIRKL